VNEKGRFGHLELDSFGAKGSSQPAGTQTFDEKEYSRRALARFGRGDYDGALQYYARALSQNAHYEPAWVGQLRCLVELGDYKEATLWAQKALEYLPDSPDLHSSWAMALAREGRYREAMELSDKALAKRGRSALVWVARAWAMGPDRLEAADRCLAKGLESSPADQWHTLVDVAHFHMHHGRYGEALQHLQKATGEKPRVAPPWYHLGMCLASLGLKNEAVAALEQACRRAPGNKEYRAELTRTQSQGLVAGLWRRLFKR